MSENLIKLAVTQFSSLLNLKLQQEQSMLRGRVMEGAHIGKQASPIQYIGAIQMQAPAGRFAPINRQDVDFTRRWVFPVDKEATQLIDTFDKLRLLSDPTSQYVSESSAAVAREWDDRIIAAAFGDAQIGTDAGSLSTETWASFSGAWEISDTFKSAASSGLTVAKMIEAKRIMRKAQVPVDREPMTWVTNSQGESDLLNQAQVMSSDFSGDQAPTRNAEGKITRFMGFDILYSERLSSASSIRSNMAFVKSGLYLGIWKDVYNKISQADWLSSQPYQLYTSMTVGATRLEPGRLLKVKCADTSTAADVTP